MNKLTTLIIISFLISPLPILAAGLQASPSSLEFSLASDQEASANLVMANPTADVQIFELSVDEYSEYIQPAPRSFTLESGARKVIAVKIAGRGELGKANQKFATNISITAKPLSEAGLSVGAGVKIPVTIITTPPQQKNLPYALPAGIIIVILVLGYLIYKKKLA